MSVYDLPDPSDIPGTSDFAHAQAQMERDEIADFEAEIVEHPAVKLACLSRGLDGRYRIVIGTETGIVLDGTQRRLEPTLFGLGLDRQTRKAIVAALDEKAMTVAVVEHDDGGATVYDVIDKDETGVPPDPARWCWDRLAEVYWS
jgi:hypothetical protein